MPRSTTKRIAGLSSFNLSLLIGVMALVVFVSLPWVEVLARSDNQMDAISIVRALGRGSEAAPQLSLLDMVRGSEDIANRFEDLELLEDEDLLRCHGYLFAFVPSTARPRALAPSTSDGPSGSLEPVAHDLVAWPWEHGRTGLTAFVHTASGRLLYHPNEAGLWEGLGGAPRGPWSDGWRELPSH